jgi:16S rRNA (uracil1498-N3)-methyltransferase
MRVLIPADSGAAAGQRVRLDQDELHHLRVRRAKEGESVEILDGAGLRGTGRLVQSGKEWAVEVQSAQQESAPIELTLAVAAGDRDRFSWMVEKAVELGVTRIIPLNTERSAGVATGLREAHLDRLRRHALQATKQCGAVWVPQVERPQPLAEFLTSPLAGVGWLADRSGAPPPERLDRSALTVVIGPEGGFADAERAGLVAMRYVPTVFGSQTLRFETAALAAAAVVTLARMRGSHG